MSLFFYGLVDLNGTPDCEAIIRREAELEGFPVVFGDLSSEYSIADLFGETAGFLRPLVFEVKPTSGEDVYDLLYNSYGGELMTKHYRTLAHVSGLPEWSSIEFGGSEAVDKLYEATPYPLPCVKFVSRLLDTMPCSRAMFAFDHNFENRFGCQDVSGGLDFVIRQVWKTIAFGYQFPNVRIHYEPVRVPIPEPQTASE
ncbi:hypothetical protein [Tuwongella immobilis]|uniref:Uncharacterized protein n=1 Tax=Tuwongella immobilis TaxID=692036 RepID=A0A6C2YV88_9BACT|nr:hypothetical protein [Tuwongella immobilis]VIP05287.1 unnamed protein product [Tuwongella immobilis]VTS07930.1 unnamed protein product [Tuwongella immobilis]